jgi:hypothetical protein
VRAVDERGGRNAETQSGIQDPAVLFMDDLMVAFRTNEQMDTLLVDEMGSKKLQVCLGNLFIYNRNAYFYSKYTDVGTWS